MRRSRHCSPAHSGRKARTSTCGQSASLGNSLSKTGKRMLYAVICTDKPGSLAIRKANRPEHLQYLKSLGDRLVLAGPFTEPDGEAMNGSLIVIEAGSLDAARTI